MPSLKTIADAVGVSPSTVAAALKNADSVSSETRKKVTAAADALGYRNRGPGRPSRTSRLSLLCVHGPGVRGSDSRSLIAEENLAGVQREAEELGLRLRLASVPEGGEDGAAFRQAMADEATNAIVLLALSRPGDYLKVALARDLPAVAINRRPRFGEHGYVEHDNFGGARQAANELFVRGCKRPLIVEDTPDAFHVRARAEGFRHQMAQEHGIHVPPPLVLADSVYPLVLEHHAEEDARKLEGCVAAGVDGFFVSNGCLALRVAATLERLGVALPGDVSVVGFDEHPNTTPGGRRVTSIGFDSVELGRLAVRLLTEQLLNDAGTSILHRSFCIETHLVRRDT